MPAGQIRNADMQLLNSADLLSLSDRNVAMEAYDAAGGQAFAGTAITVNLDTVRVDAVGSIYSLASDAITILLPGLFLFDFSVAATNSGGSAVASFGAWLEQDPATGSYAVVPGSASYAALQQSGYASARNLCILKVGENYKYRLRASRSSGSDTLGTIASASKLTVVRLIGFG